MSRVNAIYADGSINFLGAIGRPESFPELTQEELILIAEGYASGAIEANKPDYLVFWDALLVSNVYQTIRAQALTTPAVLVACTEFIAAFSDAKAGRPNVPAIQACINNLIQAGTFTPEEFGELQGLLVSANLQDLFTLTP